MFYLIVISSGRAMKFQEFRESQVVFEEVPDEVVRTFTVSVAHSVVQVAIADILGLNNIDEPLSSVQFTEHLVQYRSLTSLLIFLF